VTPRLYLIDTLFHIFRAYHALPRTMRSADGQPTNAVHGVVGILRNLWKTENVTHIGAVFEAMTGIFREEISPTYKAHREPPPEDLLRQIPLVKEACQRLGLSVWEADRFEADDVIGTLARLALAQGVAVTIVSNDKDLAQLLAMEGDIELMRTSGTGKKASVEKIRRDDVPRVFGVRADQIASFLALRGDTVDNIAGLRGVGDKTAARWLAQAGDLEGLLANPDIGGKRWSPIITDNAANLRRDLVLSTIRTDVDLDFCLSSFLPGPVNGLVEFFGGLSMIRHRGEVESLLNPAATVDDLWAV
jgi:DNA polymerase-1